MTPKNQEVYLDLLNKQRQKLIDANRKLGEQCRNRHKKIDQWQTMVYKNLRQVNYLNKKIEAVQEYLTRSLMLT